MSDQPVVVLLHGHGVDPSIWDDVYADLANEYTILRPDFSKLTNCETVEAYAENLYRILQTALVDSAFVIGHSMGGYIALAFAEKHPDMVLGLGLFNSTAFADGESKKEAREKAITILQKGDAATFISESVPKMFGTTSLSQHSKRVDQFIATFSSLPAEALLAGTRAIASRPDRSEVVRQAGFLTLIIAGREDQVVPFEKSQQLFELSDKVVPVVLEGAGHLGMVESPAEAAEAIRKFVDKIV